MCQALFCYLSGSRKGAFQVKAMYHFVTGDVEIEVTDEWGEVLVDQDRLLRNNDRREARRHQSLDRLVDELGAQFPNDFDVADQCERRSEFQTLMRAIANLEPQQKALLRMLLLDKKTAAEIAREEGVQKSTVHKRLERIYARLKQNF